MLKFVRNAFKSLVILSLGLILIVCVIGGAIRLGYPKMDVGLLLGGFVGLLIGLFIVVAVGGFIATIMNIDENLQKIANHYIKTTKVGNMKDNLNETNRIAKRLMERENDEGHPWDYKK